MLGKIKIGSWVFAAALILLFSGQSLAQDPCGGHYKGEGLKAAFLSHYYDAAVDPEDPYYPNLRLWDGTITNGNADYYQYMVPDGDCVFLYRDGHVIVGVGWPLDDLGINHERYINMRFVSTGIAGECETVSDLAGFMDGSEVQTGSVQFWTGVGFTASRQPDGKLLLTGTNALLNFGTLTPGRTYYFQLRVMFTVPGYDAWYRFDTQVKVFYGPFDDGSGGFGWEITPIHEPYDVQLVTKVGKKLVPSGPPTPHKSSVYNEVASGAPESYLLDSCYGQFCLPYKLRLERLQ